ncbi:hypothetical protein M011DRAFT_408146 [Sporormia fimetaria CBS 119925]|uniref:Uncharacterized protein n=1 Tax=Sporormia fimetaria CBS 119925 TaxID=1340428 RepID=A0A6A6V534_9PLEO|nr:hypothetical protein M011DRAFT_408146 [Sporormia fimetaria CBS 119925]
MLSASFRPPKDKLGLINRQYQYHFKDVNLPRAQRDDPVIRVILKTMFDLQKEDLAFAAARFTVWTASDTAPLYPPRTVYGEPAVKRYLFKEWHEEFPMLVHISVVNTGPELKEHNIVVRWKGEWVQLRTWLRERPNREFLLLESRKRALRSQQLWWDVNGKCFPFMELPVELQEMILLEILGGEPHLGTQYRDDGTWTGPETVTLAIHKGEWDEDMPSPEKPNYTILNPKVLPKATREMALKAAWVGSYKHFLRTQRLQWVLEADFPHHQWDCLTKVELNFSISDYFHLFEVDIEPYPHHYNQDPSFGTHNIGTHSIGARLGRLPTLKCLRMAFYYHTPYSGLNKTPWSDFYMSDRFGAVCHSAAVNWVMIIALPHIKVIPKINLCGDVKTKDVKKWKRLLDSAYMQRDQTTLDIPGFDLKREMQVIAAHHISDKPQCMCVLPCYQTHNDYRRRDFLSHLPLDVDDECTPELLERCFRLLERDTRADRRKLRPFGPHRNLEELEAEQDRENTSKEDHEWKGWLGDD